MEDGEECVLTDILLIMLKLCADSWDFPYQVRTTKCELGQLVQNANSSRVGFRI